MSAFLRNPSPRSKCALCRSGAIAEAFDPHASGSPGRTRDPDRHCWDSCGGYGELGRCSSRPPRLPQLLLRALGIEKLDLQALHREHTPALPGIF